MPHYFNRQDIGMISADCKKLSDPGQAASEKLIYLDKLSREVASPDQIMIPYTIEAVDLIDTIEQVLVTDFDQCEQKKINVQFHAQPVSSIVKSDRFFFKQIFSCLFSALVELTQTGKTIAVYLTNSDGRCIIETVSYGKNNTLTESEDYFKKHRISNAFQKRADPAPGLYQAYQYVIEDMGGELFYDFSSERINYFRMKYDAC